MSSVIEQRTVKLPFLDDVVPALILANGKIFLPVYKVCHALGISADRHIRHWKNLALWITAQKLPFRTERQGKRQVWCLPISQVPFLYGLFDWQLVSTERRLQLKRACKEQARLTVLAYREMQWRYRIMRKALFTFLINSINSYTLLQRYTDVLPGIADTECTHRIVALIKSGRSLYRDAIEHARKMVRDQGELPIIDMFRVDSENTVIDTFSMPLLPIVPQEDSEYFFTLIGQLTVWRQELEAFWGEQGG